MIQLLRTKACPVGPLVTKSITYRAPYSSCSIATASFCRAAASNAERRTSDWAAVRPRDDAKTRALCRPRVVLWIQAVVSQFAYIDDRTFSIRQLHPILASRPIELFIRRCNSNACRKTSPSSFSLWAMHESSASKIASTWRQISRCRQNPGSLAKLYNWTRRDAEHPASLKTRWPQDRSRPPAKSLGIAVDKKPIDVECSQTTFNSLFGTWAAPYALNNMCDFCCLCGAGDGDRTRDVQLGKLTLN